MADDALFVLDANVLIDYSESDPSVLTLASRHVGRIHVPSVLLEDIDALDESECGRLLETDASIFTIHELVSIHNEPLREDGEVHSL